METLPENCISLLNEFQQKSGATVEYEEGSTEGPSHNKTFTCRAIVNGSRYTDGTGKTKKEAKQNAARNALTSIKGTPNIEPTTSSVLVNSNNVTMIQQNHICWLNEYSQKNKLVFKTRESTKMDPGSATQLCTYVCKYVCGDKEYPEAFGKTKKEAKEAAAYHVHKELSPTQNTEAFDENCNGTPKSEVAALSAGLERLNVSFSEDSRSTATNNNYIAHLNNYCQKHKHVLDFKLVNRKGPAHNPEFVYKVVINSKEYPEAQGKSSKEAKQHAAQYAWTEILESSCNTQSSEDDASPCTKEIFKSEEPQSQKSSTNNGIVFRDSSAVSSPMSISPAMSPLDMKTKIKLAPNFQMSPNRVPRSKGDGPNMNVHNPAKPSADQTANQTMKSSKSEEPQSQKSSTNNGIVFRDSSAVSSPKSISPDGPNLNVHNPEKPSTDQTANQTMKSRFLGDFDSITPIGKGGFGRVFKARRQLENKYFAVKIVKSTEKALREIGALAALSHPNIVRYNTAWLEDTLYKHESSESYSTSDFSSWSDPGTKFLYIQMELCEGDTLHAWIDKRNNPKEQYPERRRDAAHISRQILQAVQHIHSKGLIHRDLKPANIMFGSEGMVKVGDFGLVTAAENDNDSQLMERTKKTGTRSYMSPEQVTQCYDSKVDIFALGLIYFTLLWNMVTKTEKQKIWSDIRRKNFPLRFSEKFDLEHKLIDKMLSPNPEDRPDATELIKELDQYPTVL
ncbi:interferon-induced, double-stranded RNA-activated protein kinase-like isoform X1 [Xyrauchen texanus]|uniref:interferon-induced, double-stranded RNA-activated protein kinase-like isoform X1 n=1 Tax=Xyrauchen texanus TaxID=154827 RepID=UPI0022421120|nr:interferon-induced, double-stranded RNA-activated protein kinase-like isoform X1 [Xyrauchen texanus]